MRLRKLQAQIQVKENERCKHFESAVIRHAGEKVRLILQNYARDGEVTQMGLDKAREYLQEEIEYQKGEDNPVYVSLRWFCGDLLTVLGVAESEVKKDAA